MKKINWKAILIVIMAFILVFALVACDPKTKGDDKNDNNKGEDVNEAAEFECPQQEFMEPFLAMTDGIGDEKIDADDNVYLSADLGIDLGTREYDTRKGEKKKGSERREQVIVGFKNEQSIELGVKLEAILDRKSEDSNGTVIKLKLYSGEVEIAGLYYALAHPENFYIDFGGQHILFPLSVNFKLDDQQYSNASLGGKLLEALKKQINIKIGGSEKSFTIDQVLTAITGGLGEDWSLDNLINNIMPIFGLNLDSVVEMIEGFGLTDLANGIKGSDGKLSLKNALSNEKICNLVFNKFIKNGNTYSASSSLLMSFIGPYIASSNADPHLELSFNKEGDAIKDGVTLSIDVAVDQFAKVHPFVAIQIKDLEFGAGKNHAQAMAVKTEDYKTDVQLEVKETLDISGVKLNEVAIDKQIALGASLKLDFATEALADNKTQANIYVQYGDKKVLDVSYVGGKIAFTVDQEPTIGTYPIADKVVELLGGTIYNWLDQNVFKDSGQKAGLQKFASLFFTDDNHNHIKSDFKGAVFNNIDPNAVLDTVVQKLVDFIKAKIDEGKNNKSEDSAPNGQGEATTSASFNSASIADLLNIIYTDASPTLADGKVDFEIGNALQFVVKFVNKMFGLPIKATDKTPAEDAWTVDGCKKQIKDMIVNMIAANDHPDVKDNKFSKEQIDAATNEFEKTLEELFAGTDPGSAHLALAGVDFTKKGTASYIDYLLSAVLGNLKASVSIDCTQGLDWTVAAAFADVTITYKSEIRVNGNPAAQKDLSAGVTDGTAGWYVG